MPNTRRLIPPLPPNDAPEISDAGVALSIVMLAMLERESEQSRLHLRLAQAIEGRKWGRVARLHRRLSQIDPTVARVPRLARAAADRYAAGEAPPMPEPGFAARARRVMLRLATFTEERLPLYWSPPPPEEPTTVCAAPKLTRACRKRMRDLLAVTDQELAGIGPAPIEPDATARRLLVEARNRRTAQCRACGRCSLSTAPLTRALPG